MVEEAEDRVLCNKLNNQICKVRLQGALLLVISTLQYSCVVIPLKSGIKG